MPDSWMYGLLWAATVLLALLAGGLLAQLWPGRGNWVLQRRLDRLTLEIEALRQRMDAMGQGASSAEVAHAPKLIERDREPVYTEPDAPIPALVSPYARAIELAGAGYEVDEVAIRCGISRGEAELIVTLYRMRAL